MPSAYSGHNRNAVSNARMSNAGNSAQQPNAGTMPSRMNMPNAGTMPSSMNSPNTGTMPYMAENPNAGMMPHMAENPNTGTMPHMTDNPNAGTMPSSMNRPNTGTMPHMADNPNAGMMQHMADMPNATQTMNHKSNMMSDTEAAMTDCDYKMGELPPCAPLSVGYVPFQQKNPPKYAPEEALTRGTLFPGLDLPYLNIVNKGHPYAGTPLGELMALGFVSLEMNLYLDTHSKDKEALQTLQTVNKLLKEGNERYSKMYGPLTTQDITSGDTYNWLDNPWPWDYTERPVK